MKNINEVREKLLQLYEDVEEGEIEVEEAGVLTNTAGKIIQTLRLELDYCKLLDEKPDIKFLTTKK